PWPRPSAPITAEAPPRPARRTRIINPIPARFGRFRACFAAPGCSPGPDCEPASVAAEMGPLHHLLLFCLYAAAAAAIVVLGPAHLPGLGARDAYALAGLVFVAGLLLHE